MQKTDKRIWTMIKNTNIKLGAHFEEFIAKQLESDSYGSVTEVIQAGLEMLVKMESERENLLQLLIEGEQSGFTDYSYKSLMEEMDNKYTSSSAWP